MTRTRSLLQPKTGRGMRVEFFNKIAELETNHAAGAASVQKRLWSTCPVSCR